MQLNDVDHYSPSVGDKDQLLKVTRKLMPVKMSIINDSGEMIKLFKVINNNQEFQVAVLENGQSMEQSDWP